jgi:hypothetical protein
MVRPGSRTLPAGTAAHSMPSMANSAMLEAPSTAASDAGVAGRCTACVAWRASSAQAPSAMMPACGTSLSAVVITCTQPAVRTPRRLINTNPHSSDTAVTAASQRCTFSSGKKTAR